MDEPRKTESMERELLIRLDDVSKVYKGAVPVHALKNINLTVQAGEFISIIGPSGSGKSTLMNILGLLDTPTEGQLYYRNKETSRWSDLTKAQFRNKEIGFIFQAHLLLPEFTAIENIMMPSFIGRKVNLFKDRALKLLDEVGLSDKINSKPAQLSGGQNQRVAIARSLMNKPSIVFADEPTGALDQKTSNDIFKLFRKINREDNMTFVIVTHERELAYVADRVIELVDGIIIRDEELIH